MSYKNELQGNNTDLQTVLSMTRGLPNAVEIVQTTGDSETVVMSQKAVTEALDEIDLKTPKNLTEDQQHQARENIGVENVLESIGSGDTLTWDGNTEGLVSVDDMFYKVSDVALSLDDFSNGCLVKLYNTSSGGESINEYSFSDVATSTENSNGVISVSSVISVSPEQVGIEYDGFVFPESGIYFGYVPDVARIASLTIPGYTGFVKKQINPKYLPKSDIHVSVVEQSLTDDQKAQARANIGAATVDDVLAALDVWEGGSY